MFPVKKYIAGVDNCNAGRSLLQTPAIEEH